MDQIINESSKKCYDFVKSESPKYEVIPIIQQFQDQVKLQNEEVLENCLREKTHLKVVEVKFQEKIEEILKETENLEKLSDIGIEAFIVAKNNFCQSVEKYKQDLECWDSVSSSIDSVRIDGLRLQETLQNEICRKMQNCKNILDDYDKLKNLVQSFNLLIIQTNEMIYQNDNLSYNNFLPALQNNMILIESKSDEMMLTITHIRERRKQFFKEKILHFSTYDEVHRCVGEKYQPSFFAPLFELRDNERMKLEVSFTLMVLLMFVILYCYFLNPIIGKIFGI